MNSTSDKAKPKKKVASERHPLSVAFGEYLKEVRIESNKSQQELAFDAAIDRTYVSLLERGLASPTLLLLMALSKPLGLPTSELVAGFEVHLAKQRTRKQPVKRRANEASLEANGERKQGTRRSPLR